MTKYTILFLAANPFETDLLGRVRFALDEEARAIQEELERSGHRDRFELVTRWAVRPLDLLRELRKIKPAIVHFSGYRGRRDSQPLTAAVPHDCGLYFRGPHGRPQFVSTEALGEVFGAVGTSVKLVVLNDCYSDVQAEALLSHIDCVIGIDGAIGADAGKNFAIGFYGGLGESESVASAYRQGRAAISLEDLRDSDKPKLRVRQNIDADQIIITETTANPIERNIVQSPQNERTRRHPEFIGRDNELSELAILGRENYTVLIHGLHGIGKTSIAREYAKRKTHAAGRIHYVNFQLSASGNDSFADGFLPYQIADVAFKNRLFTQMRRLQELPADDLVIFDEIETLLHYDISELEIVHFLRLFVEIRHPQNILIVCRRQWQIEECDYTEDSPLLGTADEFDHIELMRILPLTTGDSYALISALAARLTIRITAPYSNALVALSGGIPTLLKEWMRVLSGNPTSTQAVTYVDLVQHTDRYFYATWKHMSAFERGHLIAAIVHRLQIAVRRNVAQPEGWIRRWFHRTLREPAHAGPANLPNTKDPEGVFGSTSAAFAWWILQNLPMLSASKTGISNPDLFRALKDLGVSSSLKSVPSLLEIWNASTQYTAGPPYPAFGMALPPSDPAIEVRSKPSDVTEAEILDALREVPREPSDVTEAELRDALRVCGWDLDATADQLCIPRWSIGELLKRSNIRTADDLGADEITLCFHACAGDLDAMVAQLQVPKRALVRRVRRLRLFKLDLRGPD